MMQSHEYDWAPGDGACIYSPLQSSHCFTHNTISHMYTHFMTERIRTGSRCRWARTPPSRRHPPPPRPRSPPPWPWPPPPCSLRLLPRAVLLLCPVHLSMGRRRECLAVLGRVVTRGGRCPPRPHGAELPRQPVSQGEAHPLCSPEVQVHKVNAVIFILIDSFGFVNLTLAHVNAHPVHQKVEHHEKLFYPHFST